jgi:phospholipid-transporting ATPase
MLGPNQLLLRGAYLRNTEWIIGAVVYTGQDTRIMRNAEPARIKSSAIESTMNVLILAILIIQLILCIISASLSSAWQH